MARSTEPGQKLFGANGGFVMGDGDKVVGIGKYSVGRNSPQW
jgi:hypothetical protein